MSEGSGGVDAGGLHRALQETGLQIALAASDRPHAVDQDAGRRLLEHHTQRSQANRLQHLALAHSGGQHHRADVDPLLVESPQHFEPAHLLHAQVEDENVGRVAARCGQRLAAVDAACDHLESLFGAEQVLEAVEDQRMIVREQNPQCHVASP